MKAQTKKIIRDLLQEKGRTLAVIISITLAVFCIAMNSTSYFLLNRDLKTNYLKTNPASATFWFDSVNNELVKKIQSYPGIAQIEASRQVVCRIQIEKDVWIPILLFVKNDFKNMRIQTFEFETGKTIPDKDEILIERNALVVLKNKIGDEITIKPPNGKIKKLKISGVVHDPGQAPAWMEHMGYGYITVDTLNYLELSPNFNKADIIVKDNPLNKNKITIYTIGLKKWLNENGYNVLRTEVKEPGVHPHETQIKSFIYIESVLCMVILFLSAFIITTMITALMARQIDQIGIMKSIGGKNSQIVSIYLRIVLLLVIIGIILGLPLGMKIGYLSAGFAASQLNIDIHDYSIPYIVIILQLIISILIPLLIAIYPVLKCSRITIREAFIDYGIPDKVIKNSFFDRLLYKIKGPARALLLSIRNTFRKKGRLALTLTTLSIAGGLFISTIVMRESMFNTITNAFNSWEYDLDISFNSQYKSDDIMKSMMSIAGVKDTECWGQYDFTRIYKDNSESFAFQLFSIPDNTKMINLPLIEGRWLNQGDTNSIVINNRMLYADSRGKLDRINRDINIGDKINCKINNQIYSLRVVGVVRDLFNFGAAFINYEYFNKITGDYGYAKNIKIKLDNGDANFKSFVCKKIENSLEVNGFNAAANLQKDDLKKAVYDHFKMLVNFLSFMTILVLIVGAISLITIMNINVVERTHELGILKAIGASNMQIFRIIIFEGITIGVISWMIAVILSVPFSYLFSNNIAVLFIQSAADYIFNPMGVFMWLIISVLFSGFASMIPAWRVLKLTVYDSIAYE